MLSSCMALNYLCAASPEFHVLHLFFYNTQSRGFFPVNHICNLNQSTCYGSELALFSHLIAAQKVKVVIVSNHLK